MWASDTLRDIVSVYGYGAVALAAALEGIGIPVPGETMLVLASVYAGLTGHLSIVLVVVAAAGGAIAGDNAGYWIGRELGGRLLRHRTRRGVLNERRLRIGQYLFARHGGKVVYFARFLAVLRTLGAFLAGYNRMSWRRFVLFNGAGGSSWALAFGAAAYLLGNGIHRVLGPASIAGLIVAAAVVAALAVLVHRRGHVWADEVLRAEREREQRQRTLADSASDRGSDPPPSARNN
ncbi:MAG TPA: DedA family protein [Steroidobacteraceae bacterium]|nr:DedA family protein [Steroidobacteraceae bacterium]